MDIDYSNVMTFDMQKFFVMIFVAAPVFMAGLWTMDLVDLGPSGKIIANAVKSQSEGGLEVVHSLPLYHLVGILRVSYESKEEMADTSSWICTGRLRDALQIKSVDRTIAESGSQVLE